MSYLDWMPSDDGDNDAVAVYEYTDEAGELLFGVSRNASKEFRQWRPDAAKSNGRRWSLKGDDGKLAVRLVLYRLPRVLAAIERGEPVFVCEGEKDVHALEAAGVTATCNPMGAGKWDAAYAESLHGAHAVIVADKDAPGWAHLRTVVTALEPVTASLRAVCAAEGKDAADHLGAGHGLGDFEPLDLAAPPGWTAPDPAAATAQDGRAPAQDGRLAEVAARYVPVDWETAWKGQPDKVEWIREPLLERGTVNALFAEAGTGKSLLTLEICLGAVRAGETVTYLDDENRIADLVERLQAFGAAPGELARLRMYSFASLPPLDTPEGGSHLLALAARDGATLVVLDTTSRMVSGKENDADTFIQLYRCALVPLKARGVTVLRLDHPGKDPARGQRGSSAKDGDVDTVWRLATVVGERVYRLERTKSRSGHGDSSVILRRERGPLRHEWTVRGPSAVDTLCGQLDTLEIPPDAGRPAVRAALEAAGVKVANDLLTEAIRRRKNCPGQSADSADSSIAVSDCPSATHIGGGQADSCPGQGIPAVAEDRSRPAPAPAQPPVPPAPESAPNAVADAPVLPAGLAAPPGMPAEAVAQMARLLRMCKHCGGFRDAADGERPCKCG